MDKREDFLVGLLLVAAVGIVVGALIATSGWLERRYDLYMRAASAEGLSVDTKVLVQGLEIGRVTRIVPRANPQTGTIAFIARLSLAERFADGSRLQLPRGTHAEIAELTTISTASVIRLLPPDPSSATRMLAAGDTIDSQRKGTALDQVTTVARQVSTQVTAVLEETRRTLERTERTLDAVTPGAQAALTSATRTLGRIDSLVSRLQGAGVPDSLATAVARADHLMLHLDSIATRVQALTADNQADLRAAVANLAAASRQLNHFIDQMSQRPYRLLTGVKPLAPERPDTSADPPPRP